MNKYRVRLKTGRVIGPFELTHFAELKSKGHITGDEECQIYPVGDWKKINDFDELKDVISKQTAAPEKNEATFVKKLSDLNLGNPKSPEQNNKTDNPEIEDDENFPKEFSFDDSDATKPLSATQISNIGQEESDEENEEEVEEPTLITTQGETNEDHEDSTDELTLTETELNTRANLRNEENEDKTLVNTDTLKYLEELKKEEAKKKEEAEKQKKEEEVKEPEYDLDNDATQFISLDDLKGEVKSEADAAVITLKKEEKKHKIKKKKELIREKKKLEAEEDEDEEEEDDDKKKKIIIAVAVLVIAVFLLMPEEKKPQGPPPIKTQAPQISYPSEYESTKNLKITPEDEFKKGLIEYYKGGYKNKLAAIKHIRTSVELKFNDNMAMPWLIYLYSDVLESSERKIEDAKIIFQLLSLFSTKAVVDKNFAAAKAMFYYRMDKISASIKTVEEFAEIKGNKPSAELLCVYIDALREDGNISKANSVRDTLEKIPKKNYLIYKTLFDYYVFEGNYEKAQTMVVESEEKFKNDVGVLLRKGKLLVYKEDFESLEKLLKIIRYSGNIKSKRDYAKYIEYKALVLASKKKIKEASEMFNKALSVYDSPELRSRLASLSESGDETVNKVIVESKAQQLIAKAKAHLKKLNYKFAFADALKAKRIAPNYIPVQLFLAELQVRQSYFAQAIDSLETLYKENTTNHNIAFALADAYIEAYKFDKATRLITSLAVPENRDNPKYYTVAAKLNIFKDNMSMAISFLKKAINKNPLDDANQFRMAQIFIKYRKYQQAQTFLKKCIDLDPANVEYRVRYADIIYEKDGTEAAIGYLFNVLVDFPDNAKVMGNIAINYYKSGQQTQFEAMKEKILKIPNKDTALYDFLIKAAKLNEKYDDVIKYSKELIKINPGDLQARLYLGQVYMELQKYKEALTEFNEIKERLETYPKVQYFLSKLYLLTDDIDKAIQLAKKEIKTNPSGVDGYVLLGEIFVKQKKFLEAEEYYKKGQRIDRNNVDVLTGLAIINFKKSQYTSARDILLRAKKLAPERAEIHKLLGDVYRASQQSALAIESYKLFLELSPNSSYKENLEAYIRMMQ
jgi:tetratricopeptide (TPR) repeat protein